MKRKYYGFLAIAVMLLSLAAIGLDAFQTLGKETMVPHSVRLKTLETVSAPRPNTLREIERLDAELPGLAHPSASDISPVNLALFGYESIQERKFTATGQGILFPEMSYSLSLAFLGGTKGFCVIDGVFCEEGSVLPDGAHIVQEKGKKS
ncbi:MAG: hypothetical protein JRF37_07855 [Deltaproteobacteria bacterium]|nr:hypothetical protein [Deltaproteobacteria bacterium]